METQVASPARSNGSATKSRGEAGRALVSQQSGKVTFPNTHVRIGSQASQISDDVEMRDNPFRMPPDTDIFGLRDKDRKKRRDERSQQRKLKVHEKTTYASKINSKSSSMIRPADAIEEYERSDEDDGKAVTVKDDPEFVLSVTRDRHVEKESLTDYINKKREMFLVQYSLGVKRDEMRKLEEIAQAEERKLELAEQYLEEDAAMFDEFLKENDKNSVEAIKIAEREIKAKEEKNKEIQSMNAQIGSIKSEIDNHESQLQGYLRYKMFLEGLSPKEWLEEMLKEMNAKRVKRTFERNKSDLDKLKKEAPTPTDSQRSESRRKPSKTRMSSRSGTSMRKTPGVDERADSTMEHSESESDSEEEPALYFDHPQQLLDIFSELEEQNLSLIQNSQETEEALEEIKQTIKLTKIKMEHETEILQEQIEKLNQAIKREEEKARDLEVKARMFSFGEFKAEHQEKMLRDLNKKVSDVYRSCIGDNEANIRMMLDQKQEKAAPPEADSEADLTYSPEGAKLDSTLQMLTNIENRLEDLFEQIEMMPQDKVEAAEKAKEKERRLKMREEKVEQQRLHQEERVRRALERAKADPKKATGRKLVARSEPPQLKKREDEAADQATREEEELAYYFTP